MYRLNASSLTFWVLQSGVMCVAVSCHARDKLKRQRNLSNFSNRFLRSESFPQKIL